MTKTNEMPSSDILAWPNICSAKPLQTTIVVKEDDVKDVKDDDISIEINKQGFLEELSPPRVI